MGGISDVGMVESLRPRSLVPTDYTDKLSRRPRWRRRGLTCSEYPCTTQIRHVFALDSRTQILFFASLV